MVFVLKVHHLLSVLVERSLCRSERFVLCNHVFYITYIHAEVFTEIYFQFDVRSEDFAVTVLIVLVRFSCIAVY